MEGNSTIDFELNVKHAMAGVFLIGVIVGLTAGVVATGLNIQSGSSAPQPTGNMGDSNHERDQGQPSGSDTVDASNIETEGEPIMGESDAPVTLYMYEDFECPFCQRFEQGALPQIVNNYVDSGQVKLVWKDFPLTRIHPWAEDGAVAMECVYREGGDEAFWPVKDKVFNNQRSINTGNVNDKIVGWAAEEGVSESAVRSCIENGDAQQEVQSDISEGRNLGVSGTPTVFVNDQKLVGAQPFSQFQSAIESQLN